MVRITRRDFLKYCSIAAGALGLSASTMMKVEKVLANPVAPTVVWISGSACTGCTMSLLNSMFYTTVEDLLINRINLTYLDTAMATAGAYFDTVPYAGSNSIAASKAVYDGTAPFVLVVEGAIPTATPPGGAAGDYCRIGDLTGTATETVLGNATAFANHPSCLAVLSVGTCSSFGGIPGAQGNVCGAKGVAFSGTAMGGAIVSNTKSGRVTSVIVKTGGSYGAVVPAVSFSPLGASATAVTDYQTVIGLSTTGAGSGYTTIPNVAIPAPGVGGTQAYATAVVIGGNITKFNVTNPGSGYSGLVNATISGGGGTGGTVAVTIGAGAVTKVVVNSGGSYTAAPDVSFTPAGATAYAAINISTGDVKNRTGLAAKVINISGCPPHPDWIVGTIAHILDTNLTLPSINSNYQPVDYGYKEYQCNAGPCPWRYNNNAARSGDDFNGRYPEGNSKNLGKYKWTRDDLGCIGILGCKGRKTKADCSRRRWNSDAQENYGVNWCVGSRGGCHGCTEPAFPDKVGKFFTFV